MYSRRGVLVFGVSIVSAGCLDTVPSSNSGGGGNPAPWGREDSEMDIGVENRLESDLTFTIEFDGSELVGQVNPGSTWVSENVIENGATPTIVLRIDDGSRKEVTWEAEEENERYLLFEVTREGIDYRMSEKGAINRTQVTNSPTE